MIFKQIEISNKAYLLAYKQVKKYFLRFFRLIKQIQEESGWNEICIF